ncbi:MAG: hypothetical protein IBX72_14750 [Nitrospirae bacterium]|nr:hypothetical protein [Nitrospirota bacterium]
MKDEYLETAFGNLIWSYIFYTDGLTEEEIEQALRSHARKWGGCISCRFSIASDPAKEENIWLSRKCQVGLTQDGCGMHQGFPE